MASLKLAQLYQQGQHVDRSYKRARCFYLPAADAGLLEGQIGLFEIYRDGLGIPQDYVTAYMWINIAISATTGKKNKEYQALRKKLAEKMTPEQIALGQDRSADWYKNFEDKPLADRAVLD